MNFLDRIVDRWDWLVGKVRPVWRIIVMVFCGIGKFFLYLWRFVWFFRGVLVSLPVAAVALYIAAQAQKKLPEVLEITHIIIDPKAENALFDLFVMTEDFITRDVAIFAPLALTAFCIAMTILSKRTLYPWLISVFTLVLPIVLYVLNTYPM